MRNSSTRGVIGKGGGGQASYCPVGFYLPTGRKSVITQPRLFLLLPPLCCHKEENSPSQTSRKSSWVFFTDLHCFDLAIWNKLEKKHGSLESDTFLLVLPMPYKYWRSSSVGRLSLPLDQPHSFRGPEQGSYFQIFPAFKLTLAKQYKNRTVRIPPRWMSDSHRELVISDAASPVCLFVFFP